MGEGMWDWTCIKFIAMEFMINETWQGFWVRGVSFFFYILERPLHDFV